MKQILTTIAFLKLPDHAPDQPFPVSAAAGQSQPAEFFCPEPVTDLQQKGDGIGVVGNEKEWRDRSGFTQILKGGRGSGIQGKISHSSSGRFPYWQRSFIVFSSFDVA